MRARKALILLVLCFAGMIALLPAAEGITSITILTFSGKVEISRRPNVWDPGHTNQVLQVGDRLRTGKNSRATAGDAVMPAVDTAAVTTRVVLTIGEMMTGPLGSSQSTAAVTVTPCPSTRPACDDVEVIFKPDEDISERVIFPVTLSQSNGIEDARFVEFDDGGRKTFYATYTAYSGTAIRSELIETTDFLSFRMSPLRGSAAKNKGMALFPRKIGGKYAMIARQDNENLYLIYSGDLHCWDGGVAILKPQFPWEFVQIGNCGSPIELDEGWLLLTHGVGPIRKYSIGAVLLDKRDPSKVLARSREPLVRPEPSEREGYVPNVVYTCGAMRHNNQIVLPYAVSDTYSKFATIKIAALIQSFEH